MTYKVIWRILVDKDVHKQQTARVEPGGDLANQALIAVQKIEN